MITMAHIWFMNTYGTSNKLASEVFFATYNWGGHIVEYGRFEIKNPQVTIAVSNLFNGFMTGCKLG